MSFPEFEKRTCLGICKQYRVKKPVIGGRYEAGQARCQTCNIWMDHKGCILKDRTAAMPDSEGWFCKCCNFRVRKKPRNSFYKERLRNSKGIDGTRI